eukprot:scaffold8346_cov267-Pinguiococcus_pyrenoidosus.AAC.3
MRRRSRSLFLEFAAPTTFVQSGLVVPPTLSALLSSRPVQRPWTSLKAESPEERAHASMESEKWP